MKNHSLLVLPLLFALCGCKDDDGGGAKACTPNAVMSADYTATQASKEGSSANILSLEKVITSNLYETVTLPSGKTVVIVNNEQDSDPEDDDGVSFDFSRKKALFAEEKAEVDFAENEELTAQNNLPSYTLNSEQMIAISSKSLASGSSEQVRLCSIRELKMSFADDRANKEVRLKNKMLVNIWLSDEALKHYEAAEPAAE